MHLVIVLLHGEYRVIECASKGEAYGRADDLVIHYRQSYPNCSPRITVYRVVGKEEVR